MKQGSLIAIEGIDGAGKTTQAERLTRNLEELGFSVISTKEPTDGPVGLKIREISGSGERPDPLSELKLFQEDRRSHVDRVILPQLKNRKVVVLDRYYLSTVAYQGARGIDSTEILADSEQQFPIPNLAIILEIQPEVGLARVKARGNGVNDAFERIELLRDVARVFTTIDRPYVKRIDANGSIEAIEKQVLGLARGVLAAERST